MNRTILIIVIILLILVFGFFGGRYFLMWRMRKGLVDGYSAAAEKQKIVLPKNTLNDGLKKLGFNELSRLVKFSKALDNEEYADVLMMWNADVKDIIAKTGLSDQFKKLIQFGT